jgi:hypothetical protein
LFSTVSQRGGRILLRPAFLRARRPDNKADNRRQKFVRVKEVAGERFLFRTDSNREVRRIVRRDAFGEGGGKTQVRLNNVFACRSRRYRIRQNGAQASCAKPIRRGTRAAQATAALLKMD